MAKPSNSQAEQTKIVVFIILILLAVVATAMLNFGSAPSRKHIKNGGTVTITAALPQSQIVVDRIVEHTTRRDNEKYIATGLSFEPYEFAVVHQDYWPWQKTITPSTTTPININAFSVKMIAKRTDMDAQGSQHDKYQEIFNALRAPDIEHKLISKDKTTAVWADKNLIYADWIAEDKPTPYYFCLSGNCVTRLDVVSSKFNIRSIEFLDERNDVIIFSDDSGIYAIEFDKTDIQNFQPIYHIAVPQFIIEGWRSITVDSNGMQFKLEF